jgi:hypothetical protein
MIESRGFMSGLGSGYSHTFYHVWIATHTISTYTKSSHNHCLIIWTLDCKNKIK